MYLIDRDWCMISTRASVLLYTQFFQYVHVYSSICTVACGQSRDALLSWRWTDLSVNCKLPKIYSRWVGGLSKQKIFHYFMHMRVKTICRF